jgi:uncharacterized protein (DUF1778 family)
VEDRTLSNQRLLMRLSIDITPEQHQFLKAAAAIQGKSIKHYVLECALPNQEEQAAFAKLEQLLAQRSHAALAGEVSDKDIDAIFDEELQSDN